MRVQAVVVAVVLAGIATPARAGGVFLKLSSPKEKLGPEEGADLSVRAVSTRSVTLVAPEVWVDDGSGFRTRPDLACAANDEVALTPDREVHATCRLSLGQPGVYRIRLRYRAGGQVVETNRVTLEVVSQRAAQP